MNTLKRIASTLGLLVLISTSSAELLDYSPCVYTPSILSQIVCRVQNGSEVLEAFQRNQNNSLISSIYMDFMEDMTDDILEEIFSIVALNASENLGFVVLYDFNGVTKIPEALSQFPNLVNVQIRNMNNVNSIPAGSIVAKELNLLQLVSLGNLTVIEPKAFQGLHNTDIDLSKNKLKTIDEDVFKPLLVDSAVNVMMFDNPIACEDCGLEWLLSDDRKAMKRLTGNCQTKNGTLIDLQSLSPNHFLGCSGCLRIESTCNSLILVFIVYIMNYYRTNI